MTDSFRPQDDLFRHVNGAWLATHEIPADRGRDGAFHALVDAAEKDVREIIEDCAAGEVEGAYARRIGDLFASFMDTEAIEAAGVSPLEPDLAPIRSATSREDLLRVLGELAPTGVPGLFAQYVSNDPNSPDSYTMYVWQGGLGLPDEAYYREEAHAATRTAYEAHIATMLVLAGIATEAESTELAARIMAFETALAAGHWDRVRTRDADLTNNPMDFGQWQDLGLELEGWRTATGRPDAFERVANETPSFFTHLAEAWTATEVEDLRAWAMWRVVSARAPYLTEALAQERFNFQGRTLTGAREIKERWKRGVGLVDGAFSEAVGELYVERHFPPSHKAAMDRVVANLITAYRESITALDWMGTDTKARALEKLDTFTPKIGYPERWRDYSALQIDPADLVGNVRAANRFEFEWLADKLGRPVDRDEWQMPPQMVNAYYMPTTNEIAFPAAILQPPFFDAGGDEAANYGGIGAVIGHEIGHGFDDQGSKFDATGALNSWWTEQDRAEFEKRTAALIAQYDVLVPKQLEGSGHHVNGALTVGENIGDLGGLTIAIKAYAIELASRGSSFEAEPVIDGHSALQRLFLNWARIWREKSRDEEAIRLLAIDPHSPAEFRCNAVVRNVDAFADAFGVTEGDALHLPLEERVRIW
ncbi:MAG: peptidase M13 [Actinobacteria bacterium]|nr:peptidase M13 [Actinomycetota bacterium]